MEHGSGNVQEHGRAARHPAWGSISDQTRTPCLTIVCPQLHLRTRHLVQVRHARRAAPNHAGISEPTQSAREDVRCLQAAIHVAEEMGEVLGRSDHMLQILQQVLPTTSAGRQRRKTTLKMNRREISARRTIQRQLSRSCNHMHVHVCHCGHCVV